jgi:tRNA pseudouridine38-40 synthase
MDQSASVEEAIWPRYFVHLAYDGTAYHGWQRQPNGHSVQAELEQALRKLLRQDKVITTGCGRTDTGVHARNFYAHFNAFVEVEDPAELVFKLNRVLPGDIAVYGVYRVADRAHSRFDATLRAYEYHVHQHPDPFIRAYSAYYPWELNVRAMNEAASLLHGRHDFASFCKSGGAQKTTFCDVKRAEWVQDGDRLVFHIAADRFLRNMVRAVVGTLFEVGRGKITPAEMQAILEGRSRSMAGESVKACGLHLTRVEYPFVLGASNISGTE